MKTIDHLNEVISLIERFGLTDADIVEGHVDESNGTLHLTPAGAEKTGLCFQPVPHDRSDRHFQSQVGNVRVCYIAAKAVGVTQ